MTAEDSPSPLFVTGLRTDSLDNPLGIDVRQPRLSWQLRADRPALHGPGTVVREHDPLQPHGASGAGVRADRRGVTQSAYRVCVEDETGPVWDTGRIASDQSTHLPYLGPPLRSGRRYTWRVQAWDEAGAASDWSESAWWEMGLLDPSDWRAAWIAPAQDPDQRVCPFLRAEFEVPGAVRSARLYVTGLGLYLARLNGEAVGDWLFTPGWTSYHDRVQYQTCDVTPMLVQGPNAIGVILGDGWYRGYLGWDGRRSVYGDRLALRCQLHVVYDDGREQWVVSDETWRAAAGPILSADLYMGEAYDARLERPGWDRVGYDAGDWSPAAVVDLQVGELIAQQGPPVRRIDELRPVVLRSTGGETLYDFGQNMVGRVRLRARGPAGTVLTLRHAEVLDSAGSLYTDNLRSALQTDRYTLRGGETESYEPYFTFHGFRYVAVSADPPMNVAAILDSLTGVVIHSDMAPSGTFECAHPLVNQLQHNIVWGQKGNFLDVPTDCPQRDERMGWTGDTQVFARTAAFNFDVAGFFSRWLGDLAACQWPDGAVPHVIPDVLSTNEERSAGATGWADAAVIIPWTLYQCYGDRRILEKHYDSMAAWVDYMRQHGEEEFLFGSGKHFGDWLALDQPADGVRVGATDRELIGTAFFAHAADLLARTARLLGKARDARRYETLRRRIVSAFRSEFLTLGGRLASNTQTAYVLALHFDLLPERARPEAARRLAADIRRRGNHLSTGFLGTPYLCHVLSRFGYLDVAYALLLQETYPSWLYPVKQGATTIWERWDGIRPDGTFQTPAMNSFNHYAYGAIGDWLYRVVGGLDTDPDAPGYKRSLIRPQPGGGLTHARVSLDSPYGPIAAAWTIEAGRFTLTVTVPPNTTARVDLPRALSDQVRESGQPLEAAPGLLAAHPSDLGLSLEIGSGSYAFTYPWSEEEPQ